MYFKKGELVTYKKSNWVINDIEYQNDDNIFFTKLKIKNILSNEIIKINSTEVEKINIKPKPEQKISMGEDTTFINNLFNQSIKNKAEETEDFELLNTEINSKQNEFKNSTKVSPISNSQNNLNYITPRRFSSDENNPSDDQLSSQSLDNNQTYKFIPSRFKKEVNNNQSETLISQSSTELKQENLNFTSNSNQSLWNGVNTSNFKTKTPKQDLFSVKNDTLTKRDFLNSVEKNTSKTLNNSLSSIPLNTKKLLKEIDKDKKFTHNANHKVKNYSDQISTSTIYGMPTEFNKESLKKSKIYKNFKNISIWLILLFILMFIIPIIGIFIKVVSFSMFSGEFSFAILNTIYLFSSLQNVYEVMFFIADIFLLILSPLAVVVFLTYLVWYLIVVNDKQYKKISFFNHTLTSKNYLIEEMQDYIAQTNQFLVKINNDLKIAKLEIAELKKSKQNQQINKNQPTNFTH